MTSWFAPKLAIDLVQPVPSNPSSTHYLWVALIARIDPLYILIARVAPLWHVFGDALIDDGVQSEWEWVTDWGLVAQLIPNMRANSASVKSGESDPLWCKPLCAARRMR